MLQTDQRMEMGLKRRQMVSYTESSGLSVKSKPTLSFSIHYSLLCLEFLSNVVYDTYAGFSILVCSHKWTNHELKR